MPTPPNADTLVLFRLLADKQWHRYLEVRDAIALTVAPGRAVRRYQQDRMNDKSNKNRHHNDPLPVSRRSEAEQIEYGQRSCATAVIASWKRAGAVLQRGMNDGREIKVREGFTSWGIPGFMPGSDEESPPKAAEEPRGSTEVPPRESEPSETPLMSSEPVSVPEPEPVSVPEPEVEVSVAVEEPVVEPRVPDWANAAPGVAEVDAVLVERFLGPREGPAPVDAVSPNGGLEATPGALEWCELCGLTVGNAGLHSQWHAENVKSDTPSEMALLNESQLKDLLSKEIVDALDQFQGGLQGYLDGQFAQLEGMMAAALRMGMRWMDPETKPRSKR